LLESRDDGIKDVTSNPVGILLADVVLQLYLGGTKSLLFSQYTVISTIYIDYSNMNRYNKTK